MKKSTKSEQQIVGILKEAGVPVVDLSRQHGISQSTFYKWKAKYGGLDASALRRLKELEDENRKLKPTRAIRQGGMYANLSLEHQVLKDAKRLKKSSRACRAAGVGRYGHRTRVE